MDSEKEEVEEELQPSVRSLQRVQRQKRRKKINRKRKKSETSMSNGNDKTLTNEVKQKRLKKSTDEEDKSEATGLETSELKESFVVDMSKISSNDDGIVKVKDIQKLILFSLLAPSNAHMLPQWASLDYTCVKRVVLVLLKYVTPGLFEANNEECFPNLGSMFDVVFPFHNIGNFMSIKSPAHSLLTIVLPKPKTSQAKLEEGAKFLVGKDYILTELQLIKNDFIIPGLSEDATDFFTIPRSTKTKATGASLMFALDCEMCTSAEGRELTRISVVNQSHEVVYDSLVKPEHPITNYLTRYSGITKEDLCGVETTLKDVQEKLKEIIPPDAILIGHSLEFDFTSLKFFHNKVIDTSVLYEDGRGLGFKPGLKYLAKKYLKAEIQQNDSNGHCSIEDARTCMKLVQLKITKGPEFGMKTWLTEKSVFDYISENSTKKGVMIDRASNVKQYSSSSDAVPCEADEEVVSNVTKFSPKYDFIWAQFHSMDSVNSKERHLKVEKMKPLLQQMDKNITEIHENLKEGTLFVVVLGSADTSHMKSLRDKGVKSKKIKKAETLAKRGLCFMKLINKSQ